jgi:spore germination protein GerM
VRRPTAYCGIALVGLLFVACGVPNDGNPRTLPKNDVPFGLLVPSTTPSTVAGAPQPTDGVTVFLVSSNRLIAVGREVAPPATLFKSLTALLGGPSAQESAAGFRSAINDGTRLLSLRVQQGVATIDVSGTFVGVSGQEQILALAQIVFTATADPSVTSVLFALDDRPVEVPRGDGTLTAAGLTRADFATLAPA